jgi:hypothetical protein
VEVNADSIDRQLDSITVVQFGKDLWDGPVTNEATVANETEDVPGNVPTGQGKGEFSSGGESLGTMGARRIRAMSQAAAKFERML